MTGSNLDRPRGSLRRAAQASSIYVASMLLLAACNQGERTETAQRDGELEWARAALERNPHLEVIAVDPNAKVFTVRDAQSGDVRAVPLSELAAAPASQLTAMRSAQSQPHAAAASDVASVATAPPEPVAGIERERAGEPPAAPDDSAAAAPGTGSDASYTIERTGGQVRVTGPGVSIVSADAAATAGATPAGNNAVDPIICEGRRMMHLDNREMYVDGNAIVVRGGCEMFITNSRIVASGTAVVVQNGTLHVSNSHIEGADGSFDADSGSRLFVRGSTFRGVPRRAEQAMVQDQGGNRWR